MVYEFRLPAVRLGNDARTKNHFSPTTDRKLWPIFLFSEHLSDWCWITRQRLRFVLSLFAKSRPAKHAGSFQVSLETPVHRYNRDWAAFSLWLRALIGRLAIMSYNTGRYSCCNSNNTADIFILKHPASVGRDKFEIALSVTEILSTDVALQVRGELSACLSRFSSN